MNLRTVLLAGFTTRQQLVSQLEAALRQGSLVRVVNCGEGTEREAGQRLASIVSKMTEQCVVLAADSEDLPTLSKALRDVKIASDRPILVAMHGGVSEKVVDLLQLEADDFILSPFQPCELLARISRSIDAVGPGRREQAPRPSFGPIVGESPCFVREMNRAKQAARFDVPVFISGETGTGKEVCAREIHQASQRRKRPFVPLSGGAIPVDLIESELFGHARGAFTSADTSREGLIAQAEGGTVFIDEVDCFPLAAQVKLLRFLQEKEYRPLGTQQTRHANVRVVAATNGVIKSLLAEGRLRADLYYRLNAVPITLPPLRQRQEDVVPLARHFLDKYAVEFQAKCRDFTPRARTRLQMHRWRGNVRELEQTVQRAIVLEHDKDILTEEAIQFDAVDSCPPISTFREAKARAVADFERDFIRSALRIHQGNISRAAEASGKNRRAFWELMRKHDIDADSFR